MPIVDPFTLPAPDEQLETRTFTENGHELTLTLAGRPDYTRDLLIDEKTSAYQEKYITGEPVSVDGKVIHVPTTVRPVGKLVPRVSLYLCYVIAHLEAMQITEGTDQPLTFDQWAAYSVLMPKSMREIGMWATGLTKQTSDAKNENGDAAP